MQAGKYVDPARTKLDSRFAWIDRQLDGNTFLMGDSFTLADAYLFALTGWGKAEWLRSVYHADIDLTRYAHLRAWYERVGAAGGRRCWRPTARAVAGDGGRGVGTSLRFVDAPPHSKTRAIIPAMKFLRTLILLLLCAVLPISGLAASGRECPMMQQGMSMSMSMDMDAGMSADTPGCDSMQSSSAGKATRKRRARPAS